MEPTAVLAPAEEGEEGGYVALNPATGLAEEALASLSKASTLSLCEIPLPLAGHV